MNKRVFLLVGNSLTLYEWQDKHLLGTTSFEFSEEGFSQFRETMQALPICPAQLLVSMPNEDFYREKVPHVRKSERDLVVKRYVKKHFRDEKYTHVVFQEREKTARKDDVVLISSIGNSDEFDQWLSLIHELKIPLVGIWSTPLFFNTLLKESLAKDKNVIFVNRERNGSYRQSLFVNGSLILSRVTDSVKQAKKPKDKVKAIHDFVLQLYKFTTNKRILTFDEKIVTYCAFDEVPLSDLQEVCDLEGVVYQQYDVTADTLDKKLVLECIKNIRNKPHYFHLEDRSEFSIVQKNKKLFQCLVLLSFFMFASTGAVAIKAFDIYRQAGFNYESAFSLESDYRVNFYSVDQFLSYADQSKNLVDKIEQKRSDANQMPTDLFPGLSSVLSMEKFSELDMNNILWKRYTGSELRTIKALFESPEDQNNGYSDNEPQDQRDSDSSIYIHIRGDYFVDAISYDQAIDTMNALERELASIAHVRAVYMLRVPIDLRLDSRFQDDGGFLVAQQNREDDPSAFEFVLEYRSE